jgi:hypothetical protein
MLSVDHWQNPGVKNKRGIGLQEVGKGINYHSNAFQCKTPKFAIVCNRNA